jgi:histo-blood group ABO system transferase
MKLNKFINDFNITQKYNMNNDFNKYLLNLSDYENLSANTIFYCNNDFDKYLLNLHKGDKYIYVDNNNYNYVNNNINNNIKLVSNVIKKDNIIFIDTKMINIHNINVVNNKIIFLINASKNNNYIHRYKLLEMKLNNFNHDYLVVLCNPQIDNVKIINNELNVNIDDKYENLSKKMYLAYEYIYKNTDYTHIYKVDDDFFNVNINFDIDYNLDYYGNYIIKKLTKNYHFNKCYDNNLNDIEYQGEFIHNYAAGGYGYMLSRKALFFIINNKDYIYNEIYEDKAIGDVLYKNNIIVNKNNYSQLIYKKPEIKLKNNIPEIKTCKKCAVIMFHKNLKKIYKWRWIDKSVNTILNQTYQNYDIFEINYGGGEYSLFSDIDTDKKVYFYNVECDTHTEAMMFLLDKCFNQYNYDIVFNTNLDDFYHKDRFMKQIKCINDGYNLCSTFMTYITEENDDDKIMFEWDSSRYGFNENNFINKNDSIYVDKENIKQQLDSNHNIFNHPNICYTKKYWHSFDIYGNLHRYRDDKPFEDLSLWQRSIESNITIIPESLIFYRLHENQIGEQSKKEEKDENVDGGFMIEPSKDKSIIGIFLVCTGNYIYYVEDLINSVELNFLQDYKKMYFIATDNSKYINKLCEKLNVKYICNKICKKGFPLDTLYRYKYLLDFGIKVELYCDYIYYLDVDMRIVDKVGEEILPNKNKPLVGTKHPGFAFSNNKNGSPETRDISTAYINPDDYKNIYIAGGFNGGYSFYFRQMAITIQNNINIDKSKDIMAVWHDESHLNKYFIDNFDMFNILEPDYCYPENYHEEIPCSQKILALNKNHHKIRNITSKNKILVNAVGGLGNLLFQLFYGYSIAMRFNLEIVVKYNQIDESRESIYHYHMFDNICRIGDMDYEYTINETTKNYSNLLNNVPMNKNIYLTGYFQSTLYFNNYFDNIMKLLDDSVYVIAKDIFNKFCRNICKKNKFIAIHIRGGDYIAKSDYHKLMPESYYIDCLADIYNQNDYNENCKIILFTDDYKYVDSKFSLNYDYKISDIVKEYLPNEYKYLLNSAELELYLMALCDIIICANSTFSLWASYIGNYYNNTSATYIPKEWFGPKGPQDFTTEEFKLNDTYKSI